LQGAIQKNTSGCCACITGLPEGLECVDVCAACCGCNSMVYSNRRRVRRALGLDGDPCTDCLTVTCCFPCVACQHTHEISDRKSELKQAHDQYGIFKPQTLGAAAPVVQGMK
jgi:Cys-rich protein (TIGR01571 family)